MKKRKETLIKNQSGIASMVIVILIMTLLSLIVIAMTKNANREQRQALDRQLNSQAFYAAESGINDARDYYTKNYNNATDPAPVEKKLCDNSETHASVGQQFPGYSSTVGSSLNSYSCVLYDAQPDSLILSSPIDKSSLMLIQDKSGDPIKDLTFTWKRPSNTVYDFSGCPGSGFPASLGNCDAGVLRVELINPASTDRDALIANDFVAFISPSSNAGSSPANPAYSDGVGLSNQGVKWRGGCSGTECSITINGINKSKLMLHLRSYYMENEVKITGTIDDTSTGNNRKIEFKNGQLMVDATGRAVDVLKRIQVRVPLNQYGNGVYPEFSLQTAGAVCKLLQILPPSIGNSDDGCS